MKLKIQEFIKRLKELEQEFGVELEAAGDAADDTGLECWVEIVERVPVGNGRFRYETTKLR